MRALHSRAFLVDRPTPASSLSPSRPLAQVLLNRRPDVPCPWRVCPRHAAPAATKAQEIRRTAPPSTAAPARSLPWSAWFAVPAALLLSLRFRFFTAVFFQLVVQCLQTHSEQFGGPRFIVPRGLQRLQD